MKYHITRMLSGKDGFIEIDKARFLAIQNARNVLLELLYIEEKFDLIIENYLEFEQFILKSSSEYMVSQNQNNHWFHKNKNTLNRLLINFLTTCRLYIDQTSHHFSNMFGKQNSKFSDLKSFISDEYDSHLSYRLMEAMRNYMQHRSYPVKNISYKSKLIKEGSEKQFVFTLTAHVKPDDLEEDKKFKKSVLNELKTIGNKIDIKLYIRDYMNCLGRIHSKFREIVNEDQKSSDEIFLKAINDFKKKFGNEVSYISVAIQNDEGLYPEYLLLLTNILDRRNLLKNKNQNFENLSKRFVSGEIL